MLRSRLTVGIDVVRVRLEPDNDAVDDDNDDFESDKCLVDVVTATATFDRVPVLAAVPAVTFGLESDNRRFGVVAVAVGTDRGALEVVDVALEVADVVLPIVRVTLERNSRVYS